MEITLTEQQQEIHDKVIEHLKEVRNGDIFGEHHFLSLAGAAGTGKSTLIKYIVKTLLKMNWKIAITGPTHQSVKVVRNIIGISHRNLKFASVHSFLGLKPGEINPETGERKFKRESSNKKRSDIAKEKFDLVINDESSMVSHEMFKFIKEEMYQYNRVQSFLFAGDLFQLLPVEQKVDLGEYVHSIYNNNNVNHYTLTKLLRQKDMETIDFVVKIRDMIKNKNTKFDLFNYLINERDKVKHDNVIFYKTKKDFIGNFIKDERLGITDDCIFTFTNKDVETYNEKIRNYYVKTEGIIPEIHPLDLFVVQESTQDDLEFSQSGFVNSEILKLKRSNFEDFNFKGKIFKGYKCTTDDDRKFNMIAKESEEDYKRACELLKANAIKTKNRENWKMYYDLLGLFLTVKYHYASTTHKAQGSSYVNAWVDMTDLGYVDDDTLLRLFYVACTRAKNKIHILL